MADPTPTTHDTALVLTSDVLKVLWASMTAMVHDIHCPQDSLTEAEWETARKVWKSLDEEINAHAG